MNTSLFSSNCKRYNDMIEIDLTIFLKKAYRNWKQFFLIAIIGALLGIGIAQGRYCWIENHQPAFNEDKYTKAKNNLTVKELEEADHVYDQYRTYFRIQEAKNKHLNDSILMTLDAESAAVLQRRYLISSKQSGLVETLETMTLNPAEYQRIAQAIGGGITDHDVEEMLSMTNETWQNWEDIVLNGSIPEEAAVIPETETGGDEKKDGKYTNIIVVTAIGEDEAFCEKLFTETEAILSDAVNELSTLDNDITMTPFGEDPVRDGGETILEQQKMLLESITTIITVRRQFANDVVDKLNKNQKTYFEQLQLRDNAKDPESRESRGLVKFACSGFFLGIILYLIILCIPFLFGGHYQSTGELESATGIRLLSAVRKGTSKDDIDSNTYAAKMVSEELRAWEKDCKETILFFFAVDEGFTAEHPFCWLLTEQYGKETLRIGNPLKDPEAMASMLQSRGILIGISVEKSKRENVKRLYCTAADHEIPVLGYVAEDILL